jgi:hypothetical protein
MQQSNHTYMVIKAPVANINYLIFQHPQSNRFYQKRTSVPNLSSTLGFSQLQLLQQQQSGIQFDPDCQNVISGAVTTVTVDGGGGSTANNDR